MKVGLYFGTFNPIHVGHLIIANYMSDFLDLENVWLVVSPQNPLKQNTALLADYHRLAMVRVAIEDNPGLKASAIEFDLPKPSYTATTLAFLKEKYPENEFSLIMGEDNLRTFHKWKNHEVILKNHAIYVYPRVLTFQEEENMREKNTLEQGKYFSHPNIHLCDAPVMKVSSSYIRSAIKAGKDVRYLLTEPVFRYVSEMNFYK
jgi:nicotinate-nucleotide adenylyltransferase